MSLARSMRCVKLSGGVLATVASLKSRDPASGARASYADPTVEGEPPVEPVRLFDGPMADGWGPA